MGQAWSLRFRLLVGQVVVLAVVCIGIGAATELALYRYLVAQLDTQLRDASQRSVRIIDEPPTAPWRHHQRSFPRPGPGPVFLDAPGQPVGMVAAVISQGGAIEAGYLTTAGGRAALTHAARAELSALPVNRPPATINVDGLGRYRVVAAFARRSGDVVITGLPMSDVDATMIRVLLIFGVVTVIAVAAATTAGIVIIRR
ncbi:MAG: two-component system, OmpR family, sensor kinase, partial [Mycobacterium sp.]|nr:two-component system, OmpR family, sensor kinase [Mycobacterium sp.]